MAELRFKKGDLVRPIRGYWLGLKSKIYRVDCIEYSGFTGRPVGAYLDGERGDTKTVDITRRGKLAGFRAITPIDQEAESDGG